MKDDEIIEKICKPFCSFYKEGKEEMLCKGAEILKEILSKLPQKRFHNYFKGDVLCPKIIYQNGEMLERICRQCNFYISGCDFTDPDFKGYSPPCGGYIAIVCLIREEKIFLRELLNP
ncbi:MAG: hypothetical protein D6734_03425 [Candidatus Schekmanbacteria bacterium]|nr:MAG: hypothetical protein D6734_03425 [Candidatus Schekmanbacteria bacterium]